VDVSVREPGGEIAAIADVGGHSEAVFLDTEPTESTEHRETEKFILI
jgi:hypothetical protein